MASYIIYCDESDEKGRYYSHFYGGSLIRASDREEIERILIARKEELNLHREVKWDRISRPYAEKYADLMDTFFDLIDEGKIKTRIMFSQNMNVPQGLSDEQIDNQYFLLYYQFIKHAFGLRYCNPDRNENVRVAILLDDVPHGKLKFDEFRNYMSSLSSFPIFSREKIVIHKEDIADIDSKKHVILQCTDIILGGIQSKLNEKHTRPVPPNRRRSKRALAKEFVYKRMNKRMRELRPHFNVGISTGQENGPHDKWEHPYRHWCFIPSDSVVDKTRKK